MSYTSDAIKRIRKEKGLTQKQLGERCGIADSNIRKYESGTQNPKIETLDKIAQALEVPIFHLIEGNIEEKMNIYRQTEDGKQGLAFCAAFDGLLRILEYIYNGKCEESAWEYQIYEMQGKEGNFTLIAEDIDYIMEYLEKSLPFLVDSIKHLESPEDLNEYLKNTDGLDY